MVERCEAVEPLLSAWLDGELDARRSELVTRHLAGCAGCALVLEDIAAVRDLTRNLPVRRADDDLVAHTPVRSLAQSRQGSRGVRTLAVAACLLAGAALALGGGSEPEPPDVPAPYDVFLADHLPGTFQTPVTTPALLEPTP